MNVSILMLDKILLNHGRSCIHGLDRAAACGE